MEIVRYPSGHYKHLYGGDLHKRMKDKTTIRGYSQNTLLVQKDIMDILKREEYTDFFSLGDWFDNGYGSDVAAALSHTDIDVQMHNLLKGRFYHCIGNHLRIKLDSNPELFLIQPHKYFTSRHPAQRDYQVLKTPDVIMYGNVQVSLMHYNKNAESAADYKPQRLPETKFHIAVFHTETVIPQAKLAGLNMHNVSENSNIYTALDGVDIAIVGHIHKPLGTFAINKADGTSTTMIVPGSLTNTESTGASMHNTVNLPSIIIDGDEVTLKYELVDLHLNRLMFLKKELNDENAGKFKSLRGNMKSTLYEDVESVTFGGQGNAYQSLNQFMLNQGYTDLDKRLIKAVIHEPENIDALITMFMDDITI